jgi:murein DD-endopeptidase MepM/ murein hydrolase activator NlpD
MVDPNGFVEPPIDPLADTNPSLAIRQVEAPPKGWQKALGVLSLLGAAALTAATAFLLLSPAQPPAPTSIPPTATTATIAPSEVPPTLEPTVAVVQSFALDAQPGILPTIGADVAASILGAPLQAIGDENGSLTFVRDTHNPFTIIPDRPRSEVIQYTAVQGDTLNTLAERFKITAESIAWSNNRRIVQVLRPGDVVNIPPVDGVYVQVIGSKTIADIAVSYKVTDPYKVTDSEYNNLFGVAPDTILPSGTWIFIPGGEGEAITWNPGVTVDDSSPERRGFVTSFAAGDPGSCGSVQNPGGGAGWANPLPSGTFVRGFSAWHTGIDLAAPPGTPIMAANSGAVIFAGWNSWGYGNMVALAHGPFVTLYGHMSSIAVRCGQMVTVGTVIGGVGSTGNSSGPHLHFEIRSGNTTTDPLSTLPGLGF